MSNRLKFGQIITDPTLPQRDAVHFAVVQVTVNSKWMAAGSRVGLVPDTADVVTSNYDYRSGEDGWVGVIDPFLPHRTQLDPGDRAWLFLRPGSTTEPSHHWSHPGFPDQPPPQAVGTKWRTQEVVELCQKLRDTKDTGLLTELYAAVVNAGYVDDGRFLALCVNPEAPWSDVLIRLAEFEGGEPLAALEVIVGWAIKFEKPLREFLDVTIHRAAGGKDYVVSHGFDTPRSTTDEVAELWANYETFSGMKVSGKYKQSFFSCSC